MDYFHVSLTVLLFVCLLASVCLLVCLFCVASFCFSCLFGDLFVRLLICLFDWLVGGWVGLGSIRWLVVSFHWVGMLAD